MRFGRQTSSLQCLAWGDSRLVLCDRGKRVSWSTTKTSASFAANELVCTRRLLSSKSTPLDTLKPRYPVFKNSLQRTLEAQRAANRERVIRKVYNDLEEPVVSAQDASIIRHKDHTNDSDTNEDTVRGPIVKVEVSRQPRRRQSSGVAKQKQEPSIKRDLSTPWVTEQGHSPAQYPWLGSVRAEKKATDANVFLSNEIQALAELLRPTSREQAFIGGILDDLTTKLRDVVPSVPQLVGSRSTQIASSNSTIDLMFLMKDADNNAPSRESQKQLAIRMNPRIAKLASNTINRIVETMTTSDTFKTIQVINDRSPSLLMAHRSSGLTVKIFCKFHPPRNESFITQNLAHLPSLLPLYMVLRVLLESKNMFGWQAASVDSYGLFLLVTAFLKQRDLVHKKEGLGEQLLALLKTYGTKLDLSTTGVSAHPAEFFNWLSIRESERQYLQQQQGDDVIQSSNVSQGAYPAYLVGQRALMRYKMQANKRGNMPVATHLCIQDPTNYLNDAGRRCIRTRELQDTLAVTYHDLKAALERWDTGDHGDGTILGQVLRANFDELLQRKAEISSA